MSGADRFRKLERERPRTDEAPSSTVSADRFASVEDTPAPEAAQTSGVAEGRFAPAEERLELDRGDHGMPFTRCSACRVDSGKTALRCSNCGAPLDTPAQRAFNEQLWHQLQQEQASEHEQEEAREVARAQIAKDEADAQRRLGERVAREARDDALSSMAGDMLAPRISAGGGWLVAWWDLSLPRKLVSLGLVIGGLVAIDSGQRHPVIAIIGLLMVLAGSAGGVPLSAWNRQAGRWGRTRWF